MMRLAGISLFVLALAVSGAVAQSAITLEDFESGNMFGGGAVVADPDDANNNVLYVEGANVVMDLAAPLAPGEAIAIRVFDQGKSAGDDPDTGLPMADSRPAGNMWGWNLGVFGTYNWGILLVNRTYAGGNGGYTWTGQYFDSWPRTGNNAYSMDWYGGPRQVDALAVIGTGTVANPEFPGDGKWSTWTFTYNADGSMTYANDSFGVTKTSDPVESAITGVFVGSVSGSLGGVWIDDVQLVSAGGICNPGDADGDGDVDLDDFVVLKNNFGTTDGATCAEGDFDGDGDVDLDDFVLLKNAFGTTY